MREKWGEKLFFPPFWFLILKLDHDPGLHANNQREISKNEVRKPPPTLCMEMWTFPFIYRLVPIVYCLGLVVISLTGNTAALCKIFFGQESTQENRKYISFF